MRGNIALHRHTKITGQYANQQIPDNEVQAKSVSEISSSRLTHDSIEELAFFLAPVILFGVASKAVH